MHRYKVGSLAADADYLSVPGGMTSPEPGYERGRLLFVWGLHRPIIALIVLRADCRLIQSQRQSVSLFF